MNRLFPITVLNAAAVVSSTHELLTIATAATADDVALPAGFKEKK